MRRSFMVGSRNHAAGMVPLSWTTSFTFLAATGALRCTARGFQSGLAREHGARGCAPQLALSEHKVAEAAILECRWFQAPGTAKPTRQVFDDFWELDLRTWTWREVMGAQPPAHRPAARSACGMATSDDHVLLYGGKNAATDGSAYLGDLWAFSVTHSAWCD